MSVRIWESSCFPAPVLQRRNPISFYCRLRGGRGRGGSDTERRPHKEHRKSPLLPLHLYVHESYAATLILSAAKKGGRGSNGRSFKKRTVPLLNALQFPWKIFFEKKTSTPLTSLSQTVNPTSSLKRDPSISIAQPPPISKRAMWENEGGSPPPSKPARKSAEIFTLEEEEKI